MKKNKEFYLNTFYDITVDCIDLNEKRLEPKIYNGEETELINSSLYKKAAIYTIDNINELLKSYE